MTSIVIHPRLYAIRYASGESVVMSEGDATVITLYELFINRQVDTTAWIFRQRVLDAALRLFGQMDAWLLLQSENAHMRGYNLEFIQDTLNYIRTGTRAMQIQTWSDLLHEQTENQEGTLDPRGNNSFFRLQAGEDTISLLQKWISHPQGFNDLMCTLHVMFGRARRTL